MNGGAGDMPAMEVFGDLGSYRLRLVCEPGRYDASYLAAFTERMRVIAENFAAVDAACPIRDIPVLSPEETTTALQQSYGGDLAYDTTLTFVTLFRQQAAVRPDARAAEDAARARDLALAREIQLSRRHALQTLRPESRPRGRGTAGTRGRRRLLRLLPP